MLSRRLLRIKVIKALYAHFQTEGDSVKTARKNLRFSIDKAYDLYFQMLWLIVEVRRYAEERIEIGRRKHLPTPEEKNPNLKFVGNELIRRIEESDAVVGYLKKKSLGWSNYPELIKELYNLLVGSAYYKKYMESPQGNLKEDTELVRDFYSSPALEENELLESVLEEQSILWNDDLGFAIIMVVRTLEKIREGQSDIPVLEEFKSPDDPEFADRLFVEAADGYQENLRYVEKFTQNWDVERIAFMDNLIMTTAIAELAAFPEIPVKVTLDEYIEIAKYYSTPGSNLFINGILDRVAETLAEEGRISKEGRGLV